MTDYERETRVVRDDGTAAVERETVVDPAAGERVTVVRESSNLGWIIALIVAVVAIIIIAMFVMNREPTTNTDDITAAMEASRAAGYAEGANTAIGSMPPATTTVPVPVPVPGPSIDTSGVERSAAEAAEAAREARDAAERAADSVANSATNTTP